ncbi:MAG: amidohydrolase [Acidobacteria bacterium]|nr:amidohydrolase [Acidobacteriota bacterium]
MRGSSSGCKRCGPRVPGAAKCCQTNHLAALRRRAVGACLATVFRSSSSRRLVFLTACLLACSGTRAGQRPEPADLVLANGKVVTLNPASSEASAIAIRGDRIAAVGSDAAVRLHVGPSTKVIDLRGNLAIPGFIESHAHFTGIGRARMELDLTKARNWEEIIEWVTEAVRKARPGEWIRGRGWHQEKWDGPPVPNVEGFPTHDSLSRVSTDNPVLLTHASGHATFANARAMEMAGITRSTPNPSGGEILRDSRGNPTGVFRETASGLVSRALRASLSKRTPAEVEAESRKEIELAAQECLSKGVTSFHDAGASFRTIDLYRRMADEDKLGVRLYVMVQGGNAELAANLKKYRTIGYGRQHLTVRAIKQFMDGALGARGAWLLAPYADLPSSTGLNTTPVRQIAETARLALENDYQLCVHAIGDRANRETLDVYEAAFRTAPGRKDLRWRIEHAQHISAADIPRFGSLGVIAAMQGVHCTSDAPYVIARLGERRAEEGAYVWQKLMRTGAVVCNGTDAPVEDVSPIASYYATVSRRLKDGSVFYGDQRMSRMEALRSYTLNGAYAAFEESIKGSLVPGKLADITVLSRDILAIPETEIPKTEVLYTIVGGRILYDRLHR